MRWPWRKAPRDTAGIERSKQMLAKARADEPRVAAIEEAHLRKQEENHFGPRFHNAFGGQ